jgi:hypothetical protein
MENLNFVDNPACKSRPDNYETVKVDVSKILKSWQLSLFSYEWMLPDGRLKSAAELPPAEQPKRAAVEDLIKGKKPIERPVLGIGLMENIEIGAGRATFLTLAAHGAKTLQVHIPKSNKDEFTSFIA